MRSKNLVFLPRGGVDFCFFLGGGRLGFYIFSPRFGMEMISVSPVLHEAWKGRARGRFLGSMGGKGDTQTMKIEDGPVPLKDCIFWDVRA